MTKSKNFNYIDFKKQSGKIGDIHDSSRFCEQEDKVAGGKGTSW